jgi:hypothetical protein
MIDEYYNRHATKASVTTEAIIYGLGALKVVGNLKPHTYGCLPRYQDTTSSSLLFLLL